MGSNVLVRARALDMAPVRAIAAPSGGASSIMPSGLGAARPEAVVSRREAGTARPLASGSGVTEGTAAAGWGWNGGVGG